jgi:hypothetical protein
MAGSLKIVGDGLAACCATHLLRQYGFDVSAPDRAGPRRATLLLGAQTQSMLRDVFGHLAVLRAAPRIRKRIVCWGPPGAETVELPHAGAVVAERELLDEIWERTRNPEDSGPSGPPAHPTQSWTLISSPGDPRLEPPSAFGSRLAWFAPAQLVAGAQGECCWIESAPQGWLFLLPAGEGRGVLIGCGGDGAELLRTSRLVARQLSGLELSAALLARHPAYPAIRPEVSGERWLACGSAAMNFDPLCGEGAGHALREAILAAAVLRAIARGEPEESLLTHYSNRLKRGFLRHLRVCVPFYEAGWNSPFWKAEAAELQRGISLMEGWLRHTGDFAYRLVGYNLEALTAAASS